MRVSNRYDDHESWIYHIEDKEILRKVIQSDCKATDLFKAFIFKEEWARNDGEGEPENWQFILQLRDAYKEYKKTIKVPIKEKLFIDKLVDYIVSLFYQDSAYLERMGGCITFFIYNRKLWEGKNKKERQAALRAFYDWWDKNDKRERTKWMISGLMNCLFIRYEKQEFWMKSVDFCIDWIIEHADEWKPQPMYEPKNWYPNGRGMVQNMVWGGQG